MKVLRDLIATLEEIDGTTPCIVMESPEEPHFSQVTDGPSDFTEALEFLHEMERLTHRMDTVEDLRRALG